MTQTKNHPEITEEYFSDPEHPGEKPLGNRCTYRDCLADHAPIPHHGNGETLFAVLMCGCMVAVMTTINGLRNTGFGFLTDSLWLYPFTFCIALSLRLALTSRIVVFLRRRVIDRFFSGYGHGIAMAVTNTAVTSPIMCAIVTMLLVGPEGFWESYTATLPITAPMAIVVSYFFVGPMVKMFFNNRISPAQGIDMLDRIVEEGAPIARLMGLS